MNFTGPEMDRLAIRELYDTYADGGFRGTARRGSAAMRMMRGGFRLISMSRASTPSVKPMMRSWRKWWTPRSSCRSA